MHGYMNVKHVMPLLICTVTLMDWLKVTSNNRKRSGIELQRTVTFSELISLPSVFVHFESSLS